MLKCFEFHTEMEIDSVEVHKDVQKVRPLLGLTIPARLHYVLDIFRVVAWNRQSVTSSNFLHCFTVTEVIIRYPSRVGHLPHQHAKTPDIRRYGAFHLFQILRSTPSNGDLCGVCYDVALVPFFWELNGLSQVCHLAEFLAAHQDVPGC